MKKVVCLFISFILFSFAFICTGLNEISYTENQLKSDKTDIYLNDILFDIQINILMRLAHFSSLSTGIIKENSILWYNGYGLSNRAQFQQPNINTIYKVGSISKVVTATAMMQLWEQELFDLDEDVNNYLPFYLRNPNFPDDPITFRMLLSHQSSIFEWLETSSLNYMFSDNDYSFIEEILLSNGSEYHPEYWANYPPSAEKNYSNFGYILLGYLIEQITGYTF